MMVCPSVDLPAYNKWLNSQKVNKALLTSLPHFAFIIRIFFFKPCGMWKFPGPDSNLSNCNNLGCRSDNARSLTHSTTRKLLYNLNLAEEFGWPQQLGGAPKYWKLTIQANADMGHFLLPHLLVQIGYFKLERRFWWISSMVEAGLFMLLEILFFFSPSFIAGERCLTRIV